MFINTQALVCHKRFWVDIRYNHSALTSDEAFALLYGEDGEEEADKVDVIIVLPEADALTDEEV